MTQECSWVACQPSHICDLLTESVWDCVATSLDGPPGGLAHFCKGMGADCGHSVRLTGNLDFSVKRYGARVCLLEHGTVLGCLFVLVQSLDCLWELCCCKYGSQFVWFECSLWAAFCFCKCLFDWSEWWVHLVAWKFIVLFSCAVWDVLEELGYFYQAQQ